MTDRNLNIRVALSAANKLSGPVSAAQRSAAALASQIKNTQGSIKGLDSQAKTFDRLNTSIKKNAAAYGAAQEKAKALKIANGPLKQQTDEQIKTLMAARRERDRLGRSLDSQRQKLQSVSAQMYRHGISVRQGDNATAQITRRTEIYNRQLAEQQRHLSAINRMQAGVARAKKTRGKLAAGGTAAMATGGGMLYGMGRLLKPGLDFSAGMSDVQALARLDKNAPELKALREQALQLGASTVFTATQVSDAQKYLAQAGDSASDIIAATPGVLNLASASGADVGFTSDLMSDIRSSMGLSAKDSDHVGDVLTATFTRATTDLPQLGEAMKYAGANFRKLGVSLEDGTAMLGVMADSGIKGSMAGTATQGLSRLFTDKTAMGALSALGVSATNKDGSIRPLVNVMEDIGKKLDSFNQVSQVQLGKDLWGVEAQKGMSAVVHAARSGQLRERANINRGSDGESKAVAKTKIDNLSGDLQQMGSAFEFLRIQMAASVDTPLRKLTTNITAVLMRVGEWMKAHPGITKALTLGVTVMGAMLVALGALALMAAAVIVPLATMRLSLFMLAGNGGIGAVGGALKSLITSGFTPFFTLVKSGLRLLGGGFSLLFSPIGLLIAAIVVAAVLVWKYWEPIKAFFSGFFTGLMAGLEPIKLAFQGAFAPIAPLFDAIGSAIGKVWQWFKNLLAPIEVSNEVLQKCTSAGETFGRVVGLAISALMWPIKQIAKGLGWILEKLGVIPSAAEAAQQAIAAMEPKPKKPVMWEWDPVQKKMVAREWQPSPPDAITHVGQTANEQIKPPASAPSAPVFGTEVYRGAKASEGESGTPRDPNKLGNIVFKNRPAVTAIDGAYQEPRMQARATVLSRLKRSAVDLATSVLPQSVQPALAGIPVPMQTALPRQTISQDHFNFEVHFHGVDMSDRRALGELVKEKVRELLRETETRRRSRLSDKD